MSSVLGGAERPAAVRWRMGVGREKRSKLDSSTESDGSVASPAERGPQLVTVDKYAPGTGLTIRAFSTIHRRTKKLTDAGLLEREQRGRWAYFSLKRDAVETLAAVADLKEVCC